ncbi:hypothetical protein OGATHE_006639 [Ogataea polymorpha]|uniref:Uncharacterized protein n=1 Tax=Ogataea polymorpha TaxID=460523 RepID=A0A9P8NPS2_9ASCO|nr:hypothetical protein OGATHE_006639 [Ogataea polymorpha]
MLNDQGQIRNIWLLPLRLGNPGFCGKSSLHQKSRIYLALPPSITQIPELIGLYTYENAATDLGQLCCELLGKLGELTHVCISCWPADHESRFWVPLWDQVKVDMVDHLVSDPPIVLQNVVAIFVGSGDFQAKSFDQFFGYWQYVSKELVWDVVQHGSVVLWNHQQVAFGSGLDVQE